MNTDARPPEPGTIRDGYDRWSSVYDHDANPLVGLEEPFKGSWNSKVWENFGILCYPSPPYFIDPIFSLSETEIPNWKKVPQGCCIVS